MGEFLKGGKFKVLLAVLVLLCFFFLRSVYTGGFMPFMSGLGSILVSPVTRFSSSLSDKLEETFYPYLHARELMEENERLTEEKHELEQQLIDYQSIKNENDQFREYLEIKDQNQSLVFQPATVIGRTPDSPFGAFTIDVGTYHGVSPRDPVITADGLVGVVSEVSYGYAKVQTILDVSVSVGGVDIYTLDTGIISGSLALAGDGLCKMSYIARESGAAPGDIVSTSGIGGELPKGLIIGEIQSIEQESSGLSLYAIVRPAADITGTKTVQVITSFGGQEPSGDPQVGTE